MSNAACDRRPGVSERVPQDLREAEGEPLLPAEVKLVAWSLALGLTLLGLLVWLSNAYFAG